MQTGKKESASAQYFLQFSLQEYINLRKAIVQICGNAKSSARFTISFTFVFEKGGIVEILDIYLGNVE